MTTWAEKEVLQRQGLYDAANEHDACGVGFVAHIKGVKSHAIVTQALKILENLDEREQTIRDKAASATYSIFAATIGISAVLLLLFSRRGYLYLEAVGLVFAYLALFLIALYAVSYQYFNRKYGGGRNEE